MQFSALAARALFALAFVFIVACGQALAAAPPDSLASAQQAYKSGHYNEALAKFGKLSQKTPGDVSLHYYKAACHQALNQLDAARQEYRLVVEKDTKGTLKANAQMALNRLDQFRNAQVILGSGSGASTSASGSSSSSASSGPASSRSHSRLTVMDFYTQWCVPCKQFEPTWYKIADQYRGRSEFQRIDAEAPGNESLARRYNINVFPTFVFVDSSGRELGRLEGKPKEQTFVAKLDSLLR